ncbi:TPA: hypothetical protein IUV20_002576 [Enterococcus faecalis]|nr:hypothetical protein [Enterococcus faecalis]
MAVCSWLFFTEMLSSFEKGPVFCFFVSFVLFVGYVAFMVHALVVVYNERMAYETEIKQALVAENYVLEENEAKELLASTIVLHIEKNKDIQFEVQTKINGQEKEYLEGTWTNGQVKQIKYKDPEYVCYRELFQELEKSKLSFYSVKAKKNGLKGITKDNRVFVVKQLENLETVIDVQ